MHPPQLGAQPRDLRGRLLQGPRRAGVSPRSGREPVAPLVEQRFRHPQFFRHLPHGALAVQRQFDRLPLVVLVVLPARLVLVRLAFTHGVAGAALIPTGLFTKLAPAHRRPVGLRAVGSASFMNNPAVCPPIRGPIQWGQSATCNGHALAGRSRPVAAHDFGRPHAWLRPLHFGLLTAWLANSGCSSLTPFTM